MTEQLCPNQGDAEALAARPLLERIARMGDCIGANTVVEIMVLSQRAAAWLRENPPGQPVAIEPRGCPTPGSCSCVVPTPPAAGEVAELVGRLGWIAAQVADIGWSDDSDTIARAATLLQQLSTPAPAVVPLAVSDALIKAECSLSDIAEGEETIAAPNTFEWAEQRCAETLAIIRPVMKQHRIRSSEWPLQASRPHHKRLPSCFRE